MTEKTILVTIRYFGKFCSYDCELHNAGGCQKFGMLETPDVDDPDPDGFEADAAFELRHPECVNLTPEDI